jgi:hypothetical protein
VKIYVAEVEALMKKERRVKTVKLSLAQKLVYFSVSPPPPVISLVINLLCQIFGVITNTSVACAIGPSVTMSSTDFSF